MTGTPEKPEENESPEVRATPALGPVAPLLYGPSCCADIEIPVLVAYVEKIHLEFLEVLYYGRTSDILQLQKRPRITLRHIRSTTECTFFLL